MDPARAIGERLENACLLSAKHGNFDAAMTCKAIRAHGATRIRQNLFDNFYSLHVRRQSWIGNKGET